MESSGARHKGDEDEDGDWEFRHEIEAVKNPGEFLDHVPSVVRVHHRGHYAKHAV